MTALAQMNSEIPSFSVVNGKVAYETIFASVNDIVSTVQSAYIEHSRGKTVNPDSYFLRFPHAPANRIIALPASAGEGQEAALGIKWISSFPGNIDNGIPRASAALILNSPANGYPIACIEASVISAARTAASAVLAAQTLNKGGKRSQKIGVIGTGLIARYIVDFFIKTGWETGALHLFDQSSKYCAAFAERYKEDFDQVITEQSAEDLVRSCDVVVFATTSSEPYFSDLKSLSHNPLILHISLRDLDPKIILASYNIVDDVDHCLKAQTSLHLAETSSGNRNFVTATLPDILVGKPFKRDEEKPLIFSPFGMGILDMAVAANVLKSAKEKSSDIEIDDFFFDVARV